METNRVENFVIEFIKQNDIKPMGIDTLNFIREFDDTKFGIFKNTAIYDAGVGKHDCLILSFLSCMSQTHRKCRYDDRMKIGNYYRRTYLPILFNDNKDFFIDLYYDSANKFFFKQDNQLYIKDEGNRVNLSKILEIENKFLPDIIITLLCKFYNINLLSFTAPRDERGKVISRNYNNYVPVFENNNSKYTISICGENTHFQVCKIKFNYNSPSFIIDIPYETIENFIKTQGNYKVHTFSKKYENGNTFNYKQKKYTVFRRNYDFSLYENNGTPKIISLVVYIKDEPVTIEHDISKISESSIFVIHENKVKLYSSLPEKNLKNKYHINPLERYIKIDGKIFKLYNINIDKLKNIQHKSSEVQLTTKNTQEIIKSNKYFNIYFNKSYENIKTKILSINTNKDEYKTYIHNCIDKIFIIIDERYDIELPLNMNSFTNKFLFLQKFKKYMNSIIRVLLLLQIKNKDKIQQQINQISNYVYENMLNDLLNSKPLTIDSTKKFKTSNKPKNNDTINKNLKNIINPKYSNKITGIN
jgi:hypothetical protein